MHGPKPSLGSYGDCVYYEINGKRFLFDGHTGFLEYDISEDNPDVLARLNRLTQSGPSVSAARPSPIESGGLEPKPQHFTIFVSSSCNMCCSYCINGGGTLGGGEKTMNRETARRTLAFLEDHLKKSHKRSIVIDLYGGEPMLNPRVLLEIMGALASWQDDDSKDLRVQLFTNGTIYDKEVVEAIKRLGENIVVSVSLDGSPQRHNTHRRLKNGTGSWQPAYDYTKRLREQDIHFSVTSVVPYPYEHKETAEELIALGFDTFEIKDVIPHSYGGVCNTDIRRFDYVLWRDKYLEYNEFCLDLFREGSTICPVDRRNLFTSYRRRYRKPSRLACGAAFIKAAIDTNGDIYPCESFVHPDFVLGNVHEGWDAIKLGGFTKMLHEKGAIKSDRRECVGCFAKHVCGGGCYAMNWDVMGKINEIILERCEFIREKVKIDLYYLSEMQALESQERRVSP